MKKETRMVWVVIAAFLYVNEGLLSVVAVIHQGILVAK